MVSSALQYRSQTPLIDALMKEVGMSGGDLDGLIQSVKGKASVDTDTPPAPNA